MDITRNLEDLFIELPEPPADIGSAVGAVVSGHHLYVAGALPFSEGRIQHQGRVGVEVRPDSARLAARLAAIYALALARRELGGSLAKVKRVVRLDGFVACGFDFRDHAKVIDGAGELFVQLMGQNGRGTRMAAGVTSLPQNACVELSVVFEVK